MFKRICILSLSLLLLFLTACSDNSDTPVTYYMTEMTQSFAGSNSTRSVYEYNEDWSTSKITNYQNGEEVSQLIYEMTETGYLVSSTQDGVLETMEVIVTKDDFGNPIRTEQYQNGALYIYTDCTYDDSGNLLTYDSYMSASDMTYRMEYTYDESGNKTKLITASGSSVSITTYTYNQNHRLLLEESTVEASDQVSRTEYSYSENGLVQTAATYVNGQFSSKVITTYDTAGNKLRMEYYDSSDTLLLTTAWSYIGTDGSISSGISDQE